MAQVVSDLAVEVYQRPDADSRPVSILLLGRALSAFFIVSYGVCILGYLLFPGAPIDHAALGIFLPGFTLLSWHSFFLGLGESFVWGWYIAIVFGAIYNFFQRRAARTV